jgi:hypothetical protein
MAADPSRSGDARAWKPPGGYVVNRQNRQGRNKLIFGALLVMLALGGFILYLVRQIQPFHPPQFVSLPITEYDFDLPRNLWATRDEEALLAHFDVTNRAKQSQGLQEIETELANLAKDDRALVLYLSALALVKDKQVYLLPADAKLGDPGTWLAFTKVIDYLQKRPSRDRLLILDITHPFADPSLGVATDNVAQYVEATVRDKVDAEHPLWVLCSYGRGQVAFGARELKNTVFGYYLDQGLQGHARDYNPEQKNDDRITVKDLACFVNARVDRWVRHNYPDAQQTPQLFGQGADFTVKVVGKTQPSEEPDSSAPPESAGAEYPEYLRKGWEYQQKWLAGGVYREAPHLLRELELTLLRADKQWRTDGSQEDPSRTEGKINDLNKRMEQARAALIPRPQLALSLVVERKKQESQDIANTDKKEATKPEEKPDAKVEEAKKPFKPEIPKEVQDKVTVLLEKPDTEPEELLADAGKLAAKLSDDQIAAILDALMSDPFLKPRVKLLYLYILQSPQLPSHRAYAELILLQYLANSFDPENWPADEVQQALTALRGREVAFEIDPLAFPWVEEALERASEQWLKAEKAVGNPGANTRRGSKAMRNLLQPFNEVEASFRPIPQTAKSVADVYLAYDEALARLPGYVPYLAHASQASAAHEERWIEAVKRVQELHGLLSAGAQGASGRANELSDKLGQMVEKAAELRGILKELGEPFTKQSYSKLTDLAEMDALLDSSWLTPNDRRDLWKRRRDLALARNQEIVDKDKLDDRTASVTQPVKYDAERAVSLEEKRGEARRRVAVGFLDLAGMKRAEDVPRDLRDVFANQVPKTYKVLLGGADRLAIDRFERVLDPLEARVLVPLEKRAEPPTDVAVRERREQTRSFRAWLAKVYKAETELNAYQPHVEFYRDAHAHYLRSSP